MYSRRDFQETDRPYSYTGRKIRRAVGEQPQNEQNGQNEQENATPEVSQEHEEQRRHEEAPRRRAISSNNQVINDPKTKLVRSLQRKIAGDNQTHLIGVFGINSDNVLIEALREVEQNTNGNFIMLQQSRLIDDVFTMFGATMYNFIETEFNRRGSYRTLYDPWVKNQFCRYLTEICPGEDYWDSHDIMRLADLSLRLERDKKCRDLLGFIKQQLGCYDTKFVWNIEMNFGELNYNLLQNLSQIACDDLIIIVNSLGPLDLEVQHMGAEFGFDNSGRTGYQFLQKYFWFEDVIQAD